MVRIIIQTHVVITLNDDTATERVRKLRLNAFEKLYSTVRAYEKHGFTDWIVRSICQQKCEFIMQASKKSDFDLILKPSEPSYNGSKFQGKSRFHLEEEELLMWSLTSLKAPLNTAALNRYIELARKCFPQRINDVLGVSESFELDVTTNEQINDLKGNELYEPIQLCLFSD